MRTTTASTVAGCLLTGLLLTTQAWAQEPSSPPDSPSSSPQNAGLTVGAALGTSWDGTGPAALVSAQLPLYRHVIIEFEGTTRSSGEPFVYRSSGPSYVFETAGYEKRSQTTVAANLLFRAGTAHVTGFVGGGVGNHFTQDHRDDVSTCTALVSGACARIQAGDRQEHDDQSGLSAQFLGGVEVPVGHRLTPFAELRMAMLPNAELRVFGGLRVTLRASPSVEAPPVAARPAPRGAEIRVAAVDGRRRTGRLTTLSADSLTFVERGQTITLPLSAIDRIERVSHAARTGAAIGGLIGAGLLVSAFIGDCTDCEDRNIAFIFPAIGVGIGAAVGAMINVAGGEGRTLFRRDSSGSPVVAPILGPGRVGLAVRIPIGS